MAQINNEVIALYLEKLRRIYLSIDDTRLKKDVDLISEIITSLTSVKSNSEPRKKKKKTEGQFEKSLAQLSIKNFDALKGTKINYCEVTTSQDVIDFLESHTDSSVLKHTTALDLKLLYYILTNEKIELKGKKEDLLKSIKRNIRARRRGEAFTKTV
jgi:hypothetical protein